MRFFFGAFLSLLLIPQAAAAANHTAAELAAITERGKFLAEYDQAAWHATDAVRPQVPANEQNIRFFIARKVGEKWIVDFGKLNAEKTEFFTAYEASEAADLQHFTVAAFSAPRPDSGFLTSAAKALTQALTVFGPVQRPYNTAVLPQPDGTFYVYLYPAQTRADIFPLGGDERFLFSADGQSILERRRMHNAILELPPTQPEIGGKTLVGGFHTAVRDNIPEDTDVFHVLARRPLLPEYISAQGEMYVVKTDGSIEDRGPVKH